MNKDEILGWCSEDTSAKSQKKNLPKSFSLFVQCRCREQHIFTALLSASTLTSHSGADVVVTYKPDAQCEFQDVVSTGCPQQIWLYVWSDSVSEGV